MHERLNFRGALRFRFFGHGAARRGAIVAAVFLACLAAPAASRPTLPVAHPPTFVEQPALWVLSDADTTIYLFGTIHLLDERTDWSRRRSARRSIIRTN